MILTCPGCAARFVIPRSEDELRDVEVTHPACGHEFAPFAERPAVVAEAVAPEPVALEIEEPAAEEDPGAEDDVCGADEDGDAPAEIDTHSLRKALTHATTTPFRNIFPKLAAAGFASAAAAELVYLLDKTADAGPAHLTFALLGMGR